MHYIYKNIYVPERGLDEHDDSRGFGISTEIPRFIVPPVHAILVSVQFRHRKILYIVAREPCKKKEPVCMHAYC
jgi:hypothetical protein